MVWENLEFRPFSTGFSSYHNHFVVSSKKDSDTFRITVSYSIVRLSVIHFFFKYLILDIHDFVLQKQTHQRTTDALIICIAVSCNSCIE